MASSAVPFKAAEGPAELSTRQRHVSQRHRTVLFPIDGKRSAAEVCRMARLAGVPERCFDGLLSQALIAMPPLRPLAAPLAAPAAVVPADIPAGAGRLQVDLPLQGFDHLSASPDSTLPPARTLQPDSTLSADLMPDGVRAADPWPVSRDADAAADALAGARELLMNAVRTQTPVAGARTLLHLHLRLRLRLRLRRAGSRADRAALLRELEARLYKPHRSLVASQMPQRVRALLGEPTGSKFSPA